MIELVRFGLFKDRTIGRLTYQGEDFWTVERPWLDNQRNISCIPEGVYDMIRVNSPKFGEDTWEIANVPSRTHILIHAGNMAANVEGCVAIASGVFPALTGVSNSKAALRRFHELTDGLETEQIIVRSGILG